MNLESSYEWRKQLMWGLVLIGFGVLLLLHRIHVVDINSLWHYGPLILVVIGINRMIGYPTAKAFTNGLWFVFFGIWWFAILEEVFGLTYGTAWPLPVIFAGVVMILEPFIQKRLAGNSEANHER